MNPHKNPQDDGLALLRSVVRYAVHVAKTENAPDDVIEGLVATSHMLGDDPSDAFAEDDEANLVLNAALRQMLILLVLDHGGSWTCSVKRLDTEPENYLLYLRELGSLGKGLPATALRLNVVKKPRRG